MEVIDLSVVTNLLPELVLVVAATLIYVAGTFAGRATLLAWSARLALVLSLILLWQQQGVSEAEILAFDGLSHFMRAFALALGLLFVMLVPMQEPSVGAGDRLGSILLATVGLMLTSSAADLTLLFLGLELISIPTYVLLFLGRTDTPQAESAGKYFFLSIFSSAILLYGFCFVFGITGTTQLADMGRHVGEVPNRSLLPLQLYLAFGLILAGFGFKLAAFPFHFYAPDVYQGATNANAGLLAVLPKLAGLIGLVRLLTALAPALGSRAWPLLLFISVATMTIGNVCALWQKNVRRLLAYSSIAHAGYILIGVTVALVVDGRGSWSAVGISAALFYATVYALAAAGTFAALSSLSTDERELSTIDELAGLSRRRPWIAASLAIFMFSLSGVPPLAGFWGKLTLFSGALGASQSDDMYVHQWLVGLAIIGVLNAAIAAAYYLRIIGAICFREASSPQPLPTRPGPAWAAIACALALLVTGLAPQFIMRRLHDIANGQTSAIAADEGTALSRKPS